MSYQKRPLINKITSAEKRWVGVIQNVCVCMYVIKAYENKTQKTSNIFDHITELHFFFVYDAMYNTRTHFIPLNHFWGHTPISNK